MDMPDMTSLLQIQPGITAIIGSGGKTTLIMALARALSKRGTVIITTSTKILPPDGLPILSGADDILRQRAHTPLLCVAGEHPSGKLTAPACSFSRLAELADYVLVEADGSKGLPLKAHAQQEPVIPTGAQVICVVGADGFYKTLTEVCHRPEMFAELAGISLHSLVTPEDAANVIRKEGFAQKVLINKVETPADWEAARRFAANISLPVFAVSLQKGVIQCLW